MSVKLGTVLSTPKPVTGGAVQGSVLGVLDHNVCLNDLDRDIPEETYVAKYVDDLTIIDTAPNTVPTQVDSTGTRPLHINHSNKTQESFDSIKRTSEEKGLKINELKTQLLSVSSARFDTKATLDLGSNNIM